MVKFKLKVGPLRWKFTETNINIGTEEDFHFGVTLHQDSASMVHSSLDPSMKKETYFHEMLHVAFFVTGLSTRLGEDEEEKIIQSLSPTLLDILQSNPDFTQYVIEAE